LVPASLEAGALFLEASTAGAVVGRKGRGREEGIPGFLHEFQGGFGVALEGGRELGRERGKEGKRGRRGERGRGEGVSAG
jgi:hypothetical protein